MLAQSRHLPPGCNQLSIREYAVAAVLHSAKSRDIARVTSRSILVVPAAVSSRQRAASRQQQPEAASRVLFIGGLPGDEDVQLIQGQLAAACSQCSHQPTLIEVAQFKDDSQRSRFTSGWQHKGHALIAFTSEAAVTAAAAAVRQIPGWGEHAVLGPARKLPKHWTPNITLSPEEVTALNQQQAMAAARRDHNRRQRQRQQQRLISSVDQILQALPEPAGAAVLRQYKPLIGSRLASQAAVSVEQETTGGCQVDSNDTVINMLSTAMPEPLRSVVRTDNLQQLLTQQQQQQQPRLIRLVAAPLVSDVSSQLLFDWSKMPKVVDPAFGGQLAAADVVRAGSGPMNLRALRKHVQVESFALLLLQLTLPALKSQTPLHIVEFGCGSGNLVLPLAHLFPSYQFTAVDMKHSAVQLLQQRIQQGALKNVDVIEGMIEQYAGTGDVVLALHACGAASDWSLLQANRCGAAFIISPCCIGKINKNNTAGLMHGKQKRPSANIASSDSKMKTSDSAVGCEGVEAGSGDCDTVTNQEPALWNPQQQQRHLLHYPRSQWLTQHIEQLAEQVLRHQHQQQQQQHGAQTAGAQTVLTPLEQAVVRAAGNGAARCQEVFTLLAQAADYSHQEEHGYPDLAALAKSNVEFDRAHSMTELGYAVELVRLLQSELTAKSDVLMGMPNCESPVPGVQTVAMQQRFSWVW